MKHLYASTAVVGVLLLLSLAWVNNDPQAPFVVLILTFGATGAVVRECIELRNRENKALSSRETLIACFSPIIGALIAMLLCALFLSGLVSGDLFPKFTGTDKPFQDAKSVLRGGVSLATSSDFYKMIAWSMVAGYSERFVISKLEGLAAPPKARGRDSDA